VYSLKQFEKVYVDELKFKKISKTQFSNKRYSKTVQQGGYVHGLPKTHSDDDFIKLFPQVTNVPGLGDDGTTSWFFKRNHVEPDEE
jgi:hypothetical protein